MGLKLDEQLKAGVTNTIEVALTVTGVDTEGYNEVSVDFSVVSQILSNLGIINEDENLVEVLQDVYESLGVTDDGGLITCATALNEITYYNVEAMVTLLELVGFKYKYSFLDSLVFTKGFKRV